MKGSHKLWLAIIILAISYSAYAHPHIMGIVMFVMGCIFQLLAFICYLEVVFNGTTYNYENEYLYKTERKTHRSFSRWDVSDLLFTYKVSK